ncbi:MAG: nicotinate phosphoribosyltransferase [Bacillota bacterium]
MDNEKSSSRDHDGGRKPAEEITSLEAVFDLKEDPARPFNSAEHDEILAGYTTDIYFVKSLEMLRHLGLEDTRVTVEIFANRPGLFCGIDEVVRLLEGRVEEAWALNQGDEFSPKEVVLRVKGSYGDFGITETPLLGVLASASGWATRAREVKEAAGDKLAVCFGARHVHPSVAPVMEMAALVGGMDGCSCILAARLAGVMPTGTVPHAAILIAGDTVKIAHAYDAVMPEGDSRTILVDTFKDEAEESLRVADALGGRLDAVRLDTPSERGRVTPELVREVRARLDLAGYGEVKIFASGGLDPERIRELSEAGADGFGVGSYISSAPAIDMTMDIKEIGDRAIAKRGRIPGISETTRLRRVL